MDYILCITQIQWVASSVHNNVYDQNVLQNSFKMPVFNWLLWYYKIIVCFLDHWWLRLRFRQFEAYRYITRVAYGLLIQCIRFMLCNKLIHMVSHYDGFVRHPIEINQLGSTGLHDTGWFAAMFTTLQTSKTAYWSVRHGRNSDYVFSCKMTLGRYTVLL